MLPMCSNIPQHYYLLRGLNWVGDRLTFYLYSPKRTINKTLTNNGDDGRTGVVGREFESHVHDEIVF